MRGLDRLFAKNFPVNSIPASLDNKEVGEVGDVGDVGAVLGDRSEPVGGVPVWLVSIVALDSVLVVWRLSDAETTADELESEIPRSAALAIKLSKYVSKLSVESCRTWPRYSFS